MDSWNANNINLIKKSQMIRNIMKNRIKWFNSRS